MFHFLMKFRFLWKLNFTWKQIIEKITSQKKKKLKLQGVSKKSKKNEESKSLQIFPILVNEKKKHEIMYFHLWINLMTHTRNLQKKDWEKNKIKKRFFLMIFIVAWQINSRKSKKPKNQKIKNHINKLRKQTWGYHLILICNKIIKN